MSTETGRVGEWSLFGHSLRRVVLYGILAGMGVFYLIPIETGIMTSIINPASYTGSFPYLPPLEPLVPGTGTFSLEPWQGAIDGLGQGLVNSVILVVPATIFSGLLGSMAAFGLTTISWRGQIGIYILFVAGIFIPYQAVLVPLTQFWYNVVPLQAVFEPLAVLPFVQEYHWKLVALIITHTAYGLPICTLLFRAHYKKLSDEMVEAAQLDGASVATIYRRIILRCRSRCSRSCSSTSSPRSGTTCCSRSPSSSSAMQRSSPRIWSVSASPSRGRTSRCGWPPHCWLRCRRCWCTSSSAISSPRGSLHSMTTDSTGGTHPWQN